MLGIRSLQLSEIKVLRLFGNKKKQEYLMVKLQQEIGQKSKHKIF